MSKKIFRENNPEIGNSPNQLQDYIRVTNPIVWMVLLSVIILLAGTVVAAIFGKIEVTLNSSAYVEHGIAYIDISTPNAFKIKKGLTVRFVDEGKEGQITDLNWLTSDLLEASFAIDLPDAIEYPYPCKIITDIVSPISFIIN